MTPAFTASAEAPADNPLLHHAPTEEQRLKGFVYPGEYGFPEDLLEQIRGAWRDLGRYDLEHQAADDSKAAAAIVETLLYIFGRP
ncbi:hypothetical protein ACIGXM_14475 [Kitasatospora sp. NPDC052896]|uniref:hypothetical protein n=1 Tax=Kitasatospora sp. NPDC052896 TaxID=3364061 RepID=UPI0037C511D7